MEATQEGILPLCEIWLSFQHGECKCSHPLDNLTGQPSSLLGNLYEGKRGKKILIYFMLRKFVQFSSTHLFYFKLLHKKRETVHKQHLISNVYFQATKLPSGNQQHQMSVMNQLASFLMGIQQVSKY